MLKFQLKTIDKVSVRSVSLPKFNGKKEKFLTQFVKFEAFAAVCNFDVVLSSARDVASPVAHDTVIQDPDMAGAPVVVARKRKNIAIAHIANVFESNALMSCMHGSRLLD